MVLAASVNAQQSMIDLSKMPAGAPPREFSFTLTGDGPVSAWKVVADPTAKQAKAIAQTTTDKTGYRFPLAVYEPIVARSVDVGVNFKPVGGTLDQAAGIAVRLTDPDDYYLVRADALLNDVRFYRVFNGKRQEIKGVTTEVTPHQWHALGLRAEGDRFTIWFDGTPLFTTENKTFAKPGKVALWTQADSVTHFDALRITKLD